MGEWSVTRPCFFSAPVRFGIVLASVHHVADEESPLHDLHLRIAALVVRRLKRVTVVLNLLKCLAPRADAGHRTPVAHERATRSETAPRNLLDVRAQFRCRDCPTLRKALVATFAVAIAVGGRGCGRPVATCPRLAVAALPRARTPLPRAVPFAVPVPFAFTRAVTAIAPLPSFCRRHLHTELCGFACGDARGFQLHSHGDHQVGQCIFVERPHEVSRGGEIVTQQGLDNRGHALGDLFRVFHYDVGHKHLCEPRRLRRPAWVDGAARATKHWSWRRWRGRIPGGSGATSGRSADDTSLR
mmetsp:Transcript_5173/g.12847  ORF Transcript_5173/g.12847 Transcript_5173/m.12847 type:complete len:300 (+) Transcript_5173:968-1867(+)